MKKTDLFDVKYVLTNYEGASDEIILNAETSISFTVSALAVHGLISFRNKTVLNNNLNCIDMMVSDGQPVR